MNNVEAFRVISVLDEALSALRILAPINDESIEMAVEETGLGDDVVDAWDNHKMNVRSHKNDLAHQAVSTSTNELVRAFRRHPESLDMWRDIAPPPEEAMARLVEIFERMRKVAMKKLATTAEEEKSNREHFEEVREREEKAGKDKQSLEQQLKIERRERQGQVTSINTSIQKMQVNLEQVNNSYQQRVRETDGRAAATRDGDRVHYDGRHADLKKKAEALRKELDAVRAENKDLEAQLYKKKAKTEQEVETWLNEYDKEMAKKDSDYQDQLAAYRTLQKELEKFDKGFAQMSKERKEFEEAEWQQRHNDFQEKLRVQKMNRAVKAIQGAWRAFQELKKKKAKKGAKGKKK